MKYTSLPSIPSMGNDITIEGIRGTIAFVGDSVTKPDSKGKPYTKQEIRVTSGDGGDIWCDVFGQSITVDREDKGRKIILVSTEKDGRKQGIKTNKYGDRPVRLTVGLGANLTFVDAPATTETTAPQQQATQQQSAPAQQHKQQPKQPVNGFGAIAALWSECYNYVLPICGEASAVQAAATLFIEANKKGITATVTAPAEALKQLLPDARKLAETIVAKGGYDYDKLPTGDDLDAVVDVLIDKAAESKSREAIGVAFDRFIAGCNRSRGDAVRLLVSDWRMFLDTVA
jgi:GH24 family phage-related lysozyme (muramidase)